MHNEEIYRSDEYAVDFQMAGQQPRVVNTTCQRIGYNDVSCTTF